VIVSHRKGSPLQLALVLVSFLTARPAVAQVPSPGVLLTRLTYSAPHGCPDERAYRVAAVGYLGARNPFSPTAEAILDVKITHTGGTYWADVSGTDADGKPLGKPYHFDDPDCYQVVEAAALVVSGWLAPVTARPAPAPPPADVPVPVPPPARKPPEPPSRSEIPPDDLPPERAPPPPTPPAPPSVLRFGAAFWGDYATVRGLVPAVAVSVGARFQKAFSLMLEGHWDSPSTFALEGGQGITIAQLSGRLLLCGHFFGGWFVPCGLGQATEVQYSGTAATVPAHALARGAFGGRVAVHLPLPLVSRHLFLEPGVDLLGAFSVKVPPQSTQLPSFNFGVGLSLLAEMDAP
jgi:hypothetical protein